MVSIRHISERGIYTDLLREFARRGDEVCVACPQERRAGMPTSVASEEGVTILRVRTGNLQKAPFLEKVVSTLLVEHQFRAQIRRHLGDRQFDLVLYSTPPVTFDRVVQSLKRRYNCRSYLLLKDIFPQNAVDLGMMRKWGPAWLYFRLRERRLYAHSDWIGCMSAANVRFLLANNSRLDAERIEVCPNSIEPGMVTATRDSSRMRESLGIPGHTMLLVLGGNLGKPQGLDFLLDVLDACRSREDVHFLIVGAGTEQSRVWSHIQATPHPNVTLLDSLSKANYDELLLEADVGLILLDRRFTIPNFPSRLTAYMDIGLPVIAATDANSDVGEVLGESEAGLWVESGDLDGFIGAVDQLAGDAALRSRMGRNGRRYLEDHYTVSRAYDTIAAHLPGE